jgi:hypothetical protein
MLSRLHGEAVRRRLAGIQPAGEVSHMRDRLRSRHRRRGRHRHVGYAAVLTRVGSPLVPAGKTSRCARRNLGRAPGSCKPEARPPARGAYRYHSPSGKAPESTPARAAIATGAPLPLVTPASEGRSKAPARPGPPVADAIIEAPSNGSGAHDRGKSLLADCQEG